MNIRTALLLTHDPDFEINVTKALKESGAEILITHDVDHALEMACQHAPRLDLAIIDRSDCHAITLLTAIKTLHHDLPVIVMAASDSYHCAALAYANGAAACLAKPISAAELRLCFTQLCEPKLKLAEV